MYNIKEHLKIHEQFRHFICIECDVTFHQKGNLTRHIKNKVCHERRDRTDVKIAHIMSMVEWSI